MHVTDTNESSEFGDFRRNMPATKLRHLGLPGLNVAVDEPAKSEKQREPGCGEYRPQGATQHSAVFSMHESDCTNEQANRDAHPPRCKESDHRSSNTFWKARICESKLSEFEFGEVLRGDRVADLIVRDAVEAGDKHGKNDDDHERDEFLHETFEPTFLAFLIPC